jgi:hypothetical protein
MDKTVLIIILFIFVLYSLKYFKGKNGTENIAKFIFIYVFTYGAMEYLGMPDFLRKFLIDVLMILLVAIQTKKTHYRYPGINGFTLISVVFIISTTLSFSSIYPALTYYRTFLYPYLIFLAIYNMRINERIILTFNRLIFSLYSLQIIASIFKIIFIGVNEKFLIGTISTSGGTYSTMIPLAAIGFLSAYFLLHKQDIKYLILIIGFLFMGYAGAKRGIWLYLPVVLLIAIYFVRKIPNKPIISRKLALTGVFLLFLSAGALFFGVKYNKTLNPEQTIGGEFDMEYLQEYAIEYTFSSSYDNKYTQGRGANFINVFQKTFSAEWINTLFGYGPEAVKGIRVYGEGIWGQLGVNGPVTGITYHMVLLGLLGSFLILYYAIKISIFFFRATKYEHESYWRAFSFGGFLFMIIFLIDYLTYSSSFIMTLFPLSFSTAYIGGIILKRIELAKAEKMLLLNSLKAK